MAAEDFDVDLNLTGNALLDACLQVLTTDPTGRPGRVYINSTDDPWTLRFYDDDDDVWVTAGLQYTAGDALTLTGTDFDVNVAGGAGGIEIVSDALRISTGAAGTGLTGGGGSALAVDTAVMATRSYVDQSIQGLSPKTSVKVALTGNVNLASALINGATFDGITVATGDRVLVPAQSTASQNGIYIVAASGAASRASDADTWNELVGAYVAVEQGTANGDTTWLCTADRGGTLGTTAVTWAIQPNLNSLVAGDGLDKTGNTIDVDSTVARRNADNTIAGFVRATKNGSGAAVEGINGTGGYGVRGEGPSIAVMGSATGAGIGVLGSSSTSIAVSGQASSSGAGVQGTSDSGSGVEGYSSSGPAFKVPTAHGSGAAFDGNSQGGVTGVTFVSASGTDNGQGIIRGTNGGTNAGVYGAGAPGVLGESGSGSGGQFQTVGGGNNSAALKAIALAAGAGVESYSGTGPAFKVGSSHGSGAAFDGNNEGNIINIGDGVNDDDAATLGQSGRGYKTTVGDGTNASIVVTHNLNTRDVIVEVYAPSGSYETRGCRVERTSVNTVTLIWNSPPASNSRRVLIRSV